METNVLSSSLFARCSNTGSTSTGKSRGAPSANVGGTTNPTINNNGSDGGESGGGVGDTDDPAEHNNAINNMADSVSIVKTWKAHADSINSLQLISFPAAVLSAGNDCMAKLWEVSGMPKGVLRQGGGNFKGNKLWNFDYDKYGTYKKKITAGGDIMSEVMEMGELQIDSASDEESDISEDLDDFAKDGEETKQDDSHVYRKTPKRIPVDARTVGRRRRRK